MKMKQWIRLTRESVGVYKVGDSFEAESQDANILIALDLAVACDPPTVETKKVEAPKRKRTYKRRVVKPEVAAVLTPEEESDE